MNYVELVSFLVKSIVKDPDSVSIKQFDTDEEEIQIHVLVEPKEMGNIIGKGGSVANAMRTILQAVSYANHDKKIRLHIDTF